MLNKKGFSLVELTVALTVVAILTLATTVLINMITRSEAKNTINDIKTAVATAQAESKNSKTDIVLSAGEYDDTVTITVGTANDTCYELFVIDKASIEYTADTSVTVDETTVSLLIDEYGIKTSDDPSEKVSSFLITIRNYAYSIETDPITGKISIKDM